MAHRIIILAFVLFNAASAHAQITAATPMSGGSVSNRTETPDQRSSRQADVGFRNLGSLEIRKVRDKNNLSASILSIYRRPTKNELETLAPTQSIVDQYSSFLRQSNTGIIKLNADARCSQNAEVVNAVENCLNYKMPGGGTAYSFRYDSYRIPRLSDLILDKDILKTFGAMQQGIMVNLGDIPIENVTPQSNGLKYLLDLKFATDTDDLRKIEEKAGKGITTDGYTYGLGFFVKENTTFGLRSIAFRGKYLRSSDGFVYDEFNFDKRKDIVIVFRIVERDSQGNITIVWKELSRRDAPSLKINQDPPTQK